MDMKEINWDGEREGERETDRQTQTQTEKETERDRERETDRQIGREHVFLCILSCYFLVNVHKTHTHQNKKKQYCSRWKV